MLKLRLPPLLHGLDAPLREPNDAVEGLPKLRKAAYDGGKGCEITINYISVIRCLRRHQIGLYFGSGNGNIDVVA